MRAQIMNKKNELSGLEANEFLVRSSLYRSSSFDSYEK